MSIYALFHLYIFTLSYFIYSYLRFCRLLNSIFKIWLFHGKKTASVTLQTPRPASRAVYKRLDNHPHPNRPVFSHPLKNERLFEKMSDSKEFIFPIPCWLLVRSVIGECFWGVFHPVLFLSIALISPKLYVLCSLEPDSKASKVRNTWQSVYLASKHEGHDEG